MTRGVASALGFWPGVLSSSGCCSLRVKAGRCSELDRHHFFRGGMRLGDTGHILLPVLRVQTGWGPLQCTHATARVRHPSRKPQAGIRGPQNTESDLDGVLIDLMDLAPYQPEQDEVFESTNDAPSPVSSWALQMFHFEGLSPHDLPSQPPAFLGPAIEQSDIDTRPLAPVEAFETFMGRRYDPIEPGGMICV